MSLTFIAVIGGLGISVAVVAGVIKYTLDLYPYLYSSTRESARSGLLLKPKEYEAQLAATSLKELRSILESTAYAPLVEGASEFTSLSAALDEDWYRSMQWVEEISPPKLLPLIHQINRIFEVQDIQHALHLVLEGNRIGDLTHVRDPVLRTKLEGISDYAAFVTAFEGTGYEDVFSTKEKTKISSLLDREYYLTLLLLLKQEDYKDVVAPFKEYFTVLIDLTNLRLAIRKISDKNSVPFVPEGSLDLVELENIATLQQLKSYLSGTRYGEFLKSDIETACYTVLKKQAGTVFARYGLKAGGIVRYMILKQIELRNLRLLFRMKENANHAALKNYLVI